MRETTETEPGAGEPARALVVVDSVTDLRPADCGAVAVTGSHGGRYPGLFARVASVSGAIFCDAGRGRDDAGIAGLGVLQQAGIPAAAASADSCRIGDGEDVLDSGRISAVNGCAAAAGVHAGQAVRDAAHRLRTAAAAPAGDVIGRGDSAGSNDPTGTGDSAEKRRLAVSAPVPVWVLDSASLVTPDDDGAIVITGSHGGAPGGEPARALKCAAVLAAFNDAGVGKDAAGIGRLPLLQTRGVPAVTVSAASARIGDGTSTLEDGVISAANPAAAALGAAAGLPLKDLVNDLLDRHDAPA